LKRSRRARRSSSRALSTGADKLVTFLRREGIAANALMATRRRASASAPWDQFRSGESRDSGRDDIAARGIDVDGIRMVVNFDVPTDPRLYVHRVGRTAPRWSAGLALT